MSYKFSKGAQVIGDLKAADDTQRDTLIDFGEDYIGLETSGSVRMVISGSDGNVGIGTTTPDYTLDVAGDIGVNQYIYHNGDGNTWINFTDNRIRLNAGGNNFIDCEDPGSAPHKVRINNGGNNIDFVIKDNSNSVYFTADASTAKIGIGTDTPSHKLDIDGDIRIRGNDIRDNSGNPAISFDGSSNTTFAGRATDLSGSQIVGGVWQLDDGLIQNPNSSYNRIFFPADDNMNETVGAVSTNYKIAPFDGSAIKMQVKTTTDFTGKTLTGSLHVGVGTTNAYSDTPSVSVGVVGAAANTVYTFNFEGLDGSGLNEGNIFGFSLSLSSNYAGNETIHFTTAVRFNPYA